MCGKNKSGYAFFFELDGSILFPIYVKNEYWIWTKLSRPSDDNYNKYSNYYFTRI